jgi:hypothetical protein
MSEPADRTTTRVETSQRVGEARHPLRRPDAAPVDGVLNIWRDVGLARDTFGAQVPDIRGAAAKARRAVIGDNVEELDGHILDLVVAAACELLAEHGLESLSAIRAELRLAREQHGTEPKLAPALEALATGRTRYRLLVLIAAGENTLSRLRIAFPELTVRHSR